MNEPNPTCSVDKPRDVTEREAKARRRPRRISIEPNKSDGPQIYKSDLDAMSSEQRKAHMRRMLPQYKQVCAEMMRQVDAAREARAAHRAAAAGRQVERRGGGRPAAKRAAGARSGQDPGDDDGPSDPFERPLDRLLKGLRQLAAEYELERPYTLIPGEGGEPDAWLALCPSHPAGGPSLLIVDRGDHVEPTLRCRVGCAPAGIWRILVPDPDREQKAIDLSRELVRYQRWARERRAA